MRKIIFFLFVLCSITPCVAQEERTDSVQTVFAQIIGINKNILQIGAKLSIEIDFGLSHHRLTYDGRDEIIDENGEVVQFNSMVDAMNFMSSKGWKFESSYSFEVNKAPVVYWIISKKVKADENVREGIRQKRDKKKPKSSAENKLDPIYN